MDISRREISKSATLSAAAVVAGTLSLNTVLGQTIFPSHRPPVDKRHFTSKSVETAISRVKPLIADLYLAQLFENCFPNTLDTTVTYREIDGKPDTYVITGDIDAMWLRDSSAQVWPYLPFTKDDEPLRKLLAGVIRRQTRNILLDPYANAFFDDPHTPTQWASDYTDMKPGVHERKWEIDSLCYAVRLAHGYWRTTGDDSPFDEEFVRAMSAIMATFRDQQRMTAKGKYTFKRGGNKPVPDADELYGSPIKPNGLICSRFRPSDDPTVYQYLIPSNFFAVAALREISELLNHACDEPELAANAMLFSKELDETLRKLAVVEHPKFGKIFAYEMDGLGNVLMMDDSNIPSLLSMPYLEACSVDDPVYRATRAFAWSAANPWFFKGKYEGIGGPHCGKDMIWPMSLIIRAMTSSDETEIINALRELKATDASTGFMHESFHKDKPAHFTRRWFAWANTLFGELILKLATERPDVLKKA